MAPDARANNEDMSTGKHAADEDGGGTKKKSKASTCKATTAYGNRCKQTVDCHDCQVCDSHARRGLGQCTSCNELSEEGGGRGTGRRTTESEHSPRYTRKRGRHDEGSLGEGRFEAYGTPASCVMPKSEYDALSNAEPHRPLSSCEATVGDVGHAFGRLGQLHHVHSLDEREQVVAELTCPRSADLPEGWAATLDHATKNMYYFHTDGRVTWAKPQPTPTDQVAVQAAATTDATQGACEV